MAKSHPVVAKALVGAEAVKALAGKAPAPLPGAKVHAKAPPGGKASPHGKVPPKAAKGAPVKAPMAQPTGPPASHEPPAPKSKGILKRINTMQVKSPSKRIKVEGSAGPETKNGQRAERSAEHKAAQAQNRRFDRATNGLPGNNKAPESVILAMAADPSSRSSFMQRWAEEGESFAFAEAHEEVSDIQANQHKEDQVWLTTGQMEKEGLDPVLIAALVKHCEQDSSLWRPHPTVPWVKEGIEYQIPLRELISKTDTQATKRAVKSTANIELASAPKLAGLLRPASGPKLASFPSLPAGAVGAKAAGAVGAKAADPPPPPAPAKTQEEIEAEKAEALRKKKEERDAKKELPDNKAKTWFTNLNAKIDDLLNYSRKTLDAKSPVSAEVRAVYHAKFEDAVLHCSALRDAIGQLRAGGGTDTSLLAKIAEAEPVVIAAKNLANEYSGILRSNTKAASKAVPPTPAPAKAPAPTPAD